MIINVGKVDQAVRMVIGLLLIAMVFVGLQTSWGWIGIIPLASGLTRVCLIYRLFGFSTCA